MDIVVDTSVIIAVIANEPERESLVELTKGVNLTAPCSVHWEVGNAFSAMLKQKRITMDLALKAIGAYRKIPIRFVDIELEESLRIVDKFGIYAYDAYLIRCASKYKLPLISLDRNLISCARQFKISVLEAIR